MSDAERERSRERERKRERLARGSEVNRERSQDRGKGGALKPSSNRVFISNIPYEFRWQDLKDLFRNNVGDVSFVELFVDDNDKPRGCGVVEFSDPSLVKKCLEVMHRYELKGRKLVIKEDFGARDKFGNTSGGGQKRPRDREESRDRRFRDDRRSGGFDRSNQDGGNTYGLSPQFLESLGIHVPLISRIFVANLDYKVDKKKLKEVFRLAGKLQRVDLSLDKDGKSRGFAIVDYDHPVEAVQAISMFHNQVLYERVMTVRMDREGDRPIVKLPEGLKGIGMGLGVNGDPLRDVARNLPSINNSISQGPTGASGAGILGSVPNVQLGLSGALGNLTSASSALNNLSTNAAVLQAANLAGGLSGNLLANSLGGGDLGLASLVQNQSLAALAGSGNLGSGALSNSNFSRNDNSYVGGNQSGQNYLGGGGRGFDDQKGSNFGYGGGQSDREGRSGNTGVYSGNVNNGTPMLRNNSATIGGKGSGGYSNKILISNLPTSATFKMVNDKCSEFGDVQRLEDKGNGGVLVSFASEWEAERAIKNMDRARIDGRTIDVRFFY